MQEWSYIPVGGSLPNTEQKNLAFGAAASMVHPATGKKNRIYPIFPLLKLPYPDRSSTFLLSQAGYSVVRSLSEAPKYASVIANILKRGNSEGILSQQINNGNISMLGNEV